MLAAPASADPANAVRPAGGCGGCTPARAGDPDTGSGLTRSTFLVLGTSVNVTFAAADIVWTARKGKPNYTVTGVQLIAALPIAIYGLDFVRNDTGDWAAWTLTLGATSLVGVSVGLMIDAALDTSPEERRSSSAIRARPSVLVGWDDAQPHSGVAITGGF